MEKKPSNSLAKKIIAEMTVDHSDALEKNFDLAKQFIRITKEGKVDLLCKDKVSAKQQILLYLIGKLYARKAGFSSTDDVGNKELLTELGLPEGTLKPRLKELREKKRIRQVKRNRYKHHLIAMNMVERTLKEVEKAVKRSSKEV